MRGDNAIIGDRNHLPRKMKIRGENHFDHIWQYYFLEKNSVKLTEKEEFLRQKYEHAWTLLNELHTKAKVAKMMALEFNMSVSHAYVDIRMAEKLFSKANEQIKEAKRAIMSNVLLDNIKKANDDGNTKVIEKLILRYSRINGLDNDEHPFAALIESRKPTTIVFSTDQRSLQKMARDLVADVKNPKIIDVEHEDLDE